MVTKALRKTIKMVGWIFSANKPAPISSLAIYKAGSAFSNQNEMSLTKQSDKKMSAKNSSKTSKLWTKSTNKNS